MTTDSMPQAVAAVTAWINEDADVGRTLAAEAMDHDPIGFIDTIGAL